MDSRQVAPIMARGMLPADACPFDRPFPPDFDACPAYQPRTFVALDLRYRPLQPVWTCQHLEVRPTGATGHRFYGSCGIGDAAARERWVEQVRVVRLQALRDLSTQVNRITRPLLSELWAAKGRQLEAQKSSQGDAAETKAVQEVADRMRSQVLAFLDEHRVDLEGASLPYDAVVVLLGVVLERFVSQTSTDAPAGLPPEVLVDFPEAVRIFFDPSQGASDALSSVQQPPLAS